VATTQDFTNKLKAIQEREKLTDVDFAKKLGIHRVTWNRIKSGYWQISEAIKKRAVGLYPADLAGLYLKEALNTQQETK